MIRLNAKYSYTIKEELYHAIKKELLHIKKERIHFHSTMGLSLPGRYHYKILNIKRKLDFKLLNRKTYCQTFIQKLT